MVREAIEKNIVSISIGTIATVVISVIGLVYSFGEMKADFNTRMVLIEERAKTQNNSFINLKVDLKSEIEKNTEKLDDIYNLLIKK